MGFGCEVHHMRRFELREQVVELVFVADVDLLELEPVRFRDRGEVLQIAGIGELVDHADEIRCVVDDVPGYGRPDESGAPGYDDAVHGEVTYLLPKIRPIKTQDIASLYCDCIRILIYKLFVERDFVMRSNDIQADVELTLSVR